MRATLAMLCFNQERYVGAAIEAALSQTVPLDILISDDCSTDDTWAAINKALEGYSGPHSIRLNRNAVNIGVGAHTYQAIREARGDIVILAAGDDVSLPHRAARTLDAFGSNVTCVSSHVLCDGKTESPLALSQTNATAAVKSGGSVLGATLAFRKSAITAFGSVSHLIRYGEDILLPFRAALKGHLVVLPDALVQYRRHSSSIMGGTHPHAPKEIYIERLRQIVMSLAAIRADQMHALFSEFQLGGVTPEEFASVSASILRQMRREEPLRKLLLRERFALLSWLKAAALFDLAPKDAIKSLIMGVAPSLWQRYTAARLR